MIVVDNNSSEQNLDELLSKYRFLKVVREANNHGFAKANNIGTIVASGEIVLYLNSDIEILDSSIENAISDFSKERQKQLWTFRLLWPDGRFQNSVCQKLDYKTFLVCYTPLHLLPIFDSIRCRHHYLNENGDKFERTVDVAYGAAMMMWKSDFQELGGFSEKFFMYFEDVDFCDRFRNAGGCIKIIPNISLIHNAQGSVGVKRGVNRQYLKSKYIYGFTAVP